MPPIRLLDLAAPLEPVEFPNGRTLAVRPLDAAGYALWEEVRATQSDEAALRLLRHCVPDATDADLSTLTETMAQAIIAHARFKIDRVVEALRKNVPAPATSPASPRRRSKRKTR